MTITQTTTRPTPNAIILSCADTDISASGEVALGPIDGEDFEWFSLSAVNEDATYAFTLNIQVSDNPTQPGAADPDWASLKDDFGLGTFTVAAANGTFAASAFERHKWWRVYATAANASFGEKGTIALMLSR